MKPESNGLSMGGTNAADGFGSYLHIPFCVKKCAYCDFYSVAGRKDMMGEVLNAIYNEITLSAAEKPFNLLSCRSIYIGGGTPSLCGTLYIAGLIEILFKTFRNAKSPEITIEVNPDSVCKSALADYLLSGINRISVGVQSFNEEELNRLGRIHSVETAELALGLIREAGFANFNIDLMFGIPAQTIASWLHSLKRAVAFKPAHISFYGLTIEPGTEFHRKYEAGELEPVQDEGYNEMYLKGVSFLQDNGYMQYEISNFAQAGKESVHNRFYWDRVPYRGFGPSAHSFTGTQRYRNRADLHSFCSSIRKGILPRERVEQLSEAEMLTEFLFLSLRTVKGLQLPELKRRFPANLTGQVSEKIEKLQSDIPAFFRKSSPGTVSLSPEGMLLTDEIISRLI